MPPKFSKGKAAISARCVENEPVVTGTGVGVKVSYAHTTPYQVRAMVEWLEVEANAAIMIGTSSDDTTVKHNGATTKIAGFKNMAAYVHKVTLKELRKCKTIDARLLNQWDPSTCRSRWNSYHRKYKALCTQVTYQTGFGVPEELAVKGVTFAAFLEMECPYFKRIDDIFGHLSNMKPKSVQHEPVLSDSDTPAPQVICASDDDNDEGEDEDDDDGMGDFSLAQVEQADDDEEESHVEVIDVDDDDDEVSDDGAGRGQAIVCGGDAAIEEDTRNDVAIEDGTGLERECAHETPSEKATRLLALADAFVDGEVELEEPPNNLNTEQVTALRTGKRPARPAGSVAPQARRKKTNKPGVTSIAPTLARRVDAAAAEADAKGVEKAQNAKRKDFGSVFVESASKRLEFDERRLQAEDEWRLRQHTAEIELRKNALRLEEQKHNDAVRQKREEERNKLALQLMLSGIPVQQVKETLRAYFDD